MGIDVGARELTVATREEGGGQQRVVPNTRRGHRELLRGLEQGGQRVRVCLEASGN